VTATSKRESTSQSSPRLQGGTIPTTRELWTSVNRFSSWLEASGYATYDPYDTWGTRYGKLARRLYYQKHPLGIMMTAPLILMEIVFPRLRQLLVSKNRYATADAQLALAFLNLHALNQNHGNSRSAKMWLTKACSLAEDLLIQSVPGYRGMGWGYPFDWQHANGLMPRGTPHITATPYAYEVFTRLFDLTGENHYLHVARSITEFVFFELNDTPTASDAAASSYTPHDHSKVVNASAYRAFVLFDAARRFGDDALQTKAWRNLRFILQSQRKDGAWLYAIDDSSQAFIDHFHTCFVLKNLYKLNQHLRSECVGGTIHRGYDWYRKALFDTQDNPKPYAVAPRLQIVKLEMYDFAEAITLGVLLKREIPEAFALAAKLASQLIRHYQLPAGHWVTRVYLGGIRHTVPFLRWPQAQLFLALTNFLASREQSDPIPENKQADRVDLSKPNCVFQPYGT
jgi:hypothetical protein